VPDPVRDPEPAPYERAGLMTMLTEADLDGIYGSRMLSGTELGDRKIRARIEDVLKQTLQGRTPGEPARTKVVLVLAGHEKQLALNSTNFTYLRDTLGRDPQNWVGAEIGIKAENVQFAGRTVKGLRVKVLANGRPAPADAAAPAEMDDAIPF
jgi:hypothetical protein